ncbi:MAG: two pore domain potassium channel family protein [Clostridia bacterium]|nr:two pore domain potassium channel family protein [Clostridia bacterium]
MSIRKIRGRAIILTVLQGLLLLAVLSAMFSALTSLFMSSLMEGGIGSPDSSEQATVSETPAQVNAEEPVPETAEENAGRVKEMLTARLASMKPMAAVMWFALSLLFLMMAVTLKHEWKHNLFRYGIGAALFSCCAVIFLISENDTVYRITAILHMLGLAADHLFSIVNDHKVRNVTFRVFSVLLLGVGLAFDGKIALMVVLALTIPRIFYYIARISFSQVKLDVLGRIIRKTYAAEILFGMLLLITAFSIVLPNFELNIDTFGDALWYCFAIVTTIGFGDITAVTIPGRIISVILGLYGLIVVALITSIIVNFYSETKNAGDENPTDSKNAV